MQMIFFIRSSCGCDIFSKWFYSLQTKLDDSLLLVPFGNTLPRDFQEPRKVKYGTPKGKPKQNERSGDRRFSSKNE